MNKPKRIVIESIGWGGSAERQFFLDVQAKIVEGYRIALGNNYSELSMRNFQGTMGRVVLYLEGQDPANPKVSPPIAKAPKAPKEEKKDVEPAPVQVEEVLQKAEAEEEPKTTRSRRNKK